MTLDRRSFLRAAVAGGAALSAAGPFGSLARAASERGARPGGAGYGPLAPVRDQTTGLELLMLPRGFEYASFGWRGERMSDGVPTPGAHDGMGAFRDGDLVRLLRNHELGNGSPFTRPDATYDRLAAGGTTTLVFDPDAGRLVEDHASLGGTVRNCAGGVTPQGTWLTCEETTQLNGDVRHGYVFEVPATGTGTPVPIRAMGRFSHEATATDPATGIVYESEDAGSSALYRYLPVDPANLAAGGRLQAMRLAGVPDTIGWTTGAAAAADWVDVDHPDPGPGEPTTWQQARAKGAARISRGEGLWYGNGVVYVVSTDGGPARQGQVFAYEPATGTFRCVFASPSADVLNAPDNICVSPRGGLVLCEDGGGPEYLHGLTPDGEIFRLARNNVVLPAEVMAARGYAGSNDFRGSEWCGAVFEPKNGNWLFANLQSPGITFAITGPWRQGAL